MLLAGWLTRLKNHLRSGHRAPRRYQSPLSPYGLQDWLLENRTLMTAPPYPLPGNNNAPNGAASVLWNGGTYPGQSTPIPAPTQGQYQKQVTIQNNTQQIIYPVLRNANTGGNVYDPPDAKLYGIQEFREYLGFTTAGGTYLGLPPGASITITVPLVFWNGENGYLVSDGQNLVPASGAVTNPYNYSTASTRYSATNATTAGGTQWVNSFSTPGGNPYKATGGAVLFYRDIKPVGFTEGALDQLTEWTIRDPYLGKYFGVAGDNGSQNIFDYDISYVNDALMPATAQATSAQGNPNGQATGNYGYTGSTINFLNNPSDPANSPSMQVLLNEFITNTNLPDGGLGSYFNNKNAPTPNPGWPVFYNPNNASTVGNIIPSGANLFTQSPLYNTVGNFYGNKSPYDQNQWTLTSAGTGPIQAYPGGGTVGAASNTNTFTLTFPSTAAVQTFVQNLQGWITNKTPFLVTVGGVPSPPPVVATEVTSVTQTGATTAQIVLPTTLSTGNAVWLFTRTPTDYAAQQVASVWYAWVNYYLNTVLKNFTSANYTGTYQNLNIPGVTTQALVLDNKPTDLMPGMVVGGQPGIPAGTTIAYISGNTVYLSKIIPMAGDQKYTFSKPASTGPTAPVPYRTSANLYAINLTNFTDAPYAAAFSAVVYETMAFENQSTFDTPTNALQVVGKVIGADLNPNNYKKAGNASDAYTVEHILRDEIKSILRGVPDFTQSQWSSESLWYPAPSKPTGGQSYNAYNIDPFVWFVHDVLHFSGYGFSIDDDSGNVQAFTSSLVMTIGGPSGLPNKTPWSNQVQYGQQIAMAQILAPSNNVPPQYKDNSLLLLQDQSLILPAIKQINADSDLGLGAAVTGTGIPVNKNNPVRVLAVVDDSALPGKKVLVLNTSSAKVSSGYVRLIFTSKYSNASSVVDQNFAAQGDGSLGTGWANVGSGGLTISNHQAVGISSGKMPLTTDEAEYTPSGNLTNMAVNAVAFVSNSVTYSYAGVFARKDSKNNFYALLLVHDPGLNSSNFVELARFTPGLAGTVGGWTFLQVANLPSGYTTATSAELQLEVLGVGLHTSLQAYVKDPATNKTILTLSWTEGDAIYQFAGPYAGGVQTNPINGPGTAGLLTFFAGGAFTNFTVFQLNYSSLNPGQPTLLGGSNDSNDAFVQGVYQSLLGRSADGAAEYWVDQLENGVSPSAVVQAIEASTEYLNDQVNNFYEQYLGRAADTGGLAYWTSLLQNGGTFEQVISGLVSSSEYYALQGGTTSDFVASLYTNILGRTGSPSEIQGWVKAVDGGLTAAHVANDFLNSEEYRTNLVESYYQTYLGRAADPLGLVDAVTELGQGVSDQVVVASLIGSPEGFEDFSSQPTVPLDSADPNTAYVQFLYENLLGRSLDSGSDYWINLLDSGAAPSVVVQGIEASTEYLNDQVNNLYEQYLQRTADSGGLNSWATLLQNGGTIEQVISGLVSSPEYYNLQGGGTPSPSAFVGSLYTNILGRTGSPSEIQGWVTAMANGTTAAQVANAFLSSQEYQTNLVEFDYQTYLGRPADAQSLAYWVNQLEQGLQDQALLAAILGSPEAYGIYS